MAFTQAQWFAKLKSFVPGWLFEKDDELYTPAVYQGTAQVLAEADGLNDYFDTQTFIQQAENPYLAEHGFERGLTQLELESDADFAYRIANLKGLSDIPDLKALIDAVLLVEESIFHEHYAGGPCLNRLSFLNRNEVLIEKHYNWFTVIVPPQKHVPYSFLCTGGPDETHRSTFANRGNYAGSLTTLPVGRVLSVVDQLIQKNKAFGVGYRLYEGKH